MLLTYYRVVCVCVCVFFKLSFHDLADVVGCVHITPEWVFTRPSTSPVAFKTEMKCRKVFAVFFADAWHESWICPLSSACGGRGSFAPHQLFNSVTMGLVEEEKRISAALLRAFG